MSLAARELEWEAESVSELEMELETEQKEQWAAQSVLDRNTPELAQEARIRWPFACRPFGNLRSSAKSTTDGHRVRERTPFCGSLIKITVAVAQRRRASPARVVCCNVCRRKSLTPGERAYTRH